MSNAANDGLFYPTTFQEFMGVVSRWHQARDVSMKPGESLGGALVRTSHELDDAVAIFRQVWSNAEAGRNGADCRAATVENIAQQWDGCMAPMFDSAGNETDPIDIGKTIRADNADTGTKQ